MLIICSYMYRSDCDSEGCIYMYIYIGYHLSIKGKGKFRMTQTFISLRSGHCNIGNVSVLRSNHTP